MGAEVYLAPVSEVATGTKLRCDGDFTCLSEGDIVTVAQDIGGLYVPCRCGQHDLEGQLDTAGKHYVGFLIVGDA